MATFQKTDKPKILTESDQVLVDLQAELTELKTRMSSIEDEQEKNKALVEKLSFHEELSNELMVNHQDEMQHNRENYRFIADAVGNLKSPVSSVVQNLSGLIAEIDDLQTQRTLQECVDTASNVLHSFDDMKEFCLAAGGRVSSNPVSVVAREFFRDLVSGFQAAVQQNQLAYRLFIDKQVPQTIVTNPDTVRLCLGNLIRELRHLSPVAQTSISITSEKNRIKYGIGVEDLSVSIKCKDPTQVCWQDSWTESVSLNQTMLLKSGINLLKTRDILRKSGGFLEILEERSYVNGFKMVLPFST